MTAKNLFNIGDTVVSKIDESGRKMMITGILIYSTGIEYEVSFFDNVRTFYEFELKEYTEDKKKQKRCDFRLFTIEYLKCLKYDEYIRLLDENDEKKVNDILSMLVAGEEYEMAEVTKRYLNRDRKKDIS